MYGSSSEPAALVGSTIERYEVQRYIGGGGFGAVYEARHSVMHRQVALKVLHQSRAEAKDVVRRFFEESRAAAAIGSDHIVEVYDAGTTDEGVHFLAMELIDGCSLEEALEGQPVMPLARAAGIILQILDGLRAAHSAGIVHRDIKPANVMLEGTRADRTAMLDRVRLLDFGISKMTRPDAASLTKSGVVMGTPGYAAPEQYLSAGSVDARADVYSAAAVLFRMLTGELPHLRTTSYEEMVVKVVTEPPRRLSELRPDLPDALGEVLMHALTPETANRVPSAHAFADGLRVVLSGHVEGIEGDFEPGSWDVAAASTLSLAAPPQITTDPVVSAPPPAAPEPTPPLPVRRVPWRLLAGGALVTIGLAAAAALWLAPIDAEAPDVEPTENTEPDEPHAEGSELPVPMHPPPAPSGEGDAEFGHSPPPESGEGDAEFGHSAVAPAEPTQAEPESPEPAQRARRQPQTPDPTPVPAPQPLEQPEQRQPTGTEVLVPFDM